MFVTWLAQKLSIMGVPMVEVPQTNQRMGRGTKAVYDLAATGRLIHNGNATLRRHMTNAVTEAINAGERVSKDQKRRRIDLAVALVMCAYLAIGDEPKAAAPSPGLFYLDGEAA
jgi:phage terminase large subunit-like protein